MSNARLQRLVERTVDIDLPTVLADYGDPGSDADLDEFLAYLRRRALIDANAFVELHGQDEIVLDGAPAPPGASRYALLGPVGEGAMGIVHVARDLPLGRKVAYKTMLRHDPLRHRRFLDEVRITAQLDHPNVVPVYSVEQDGEGRPAYAMKLVRGRTLKHLLAEARAERDAGRAATEDLRLVMRLERFLKVCDAVAYAHSKGIIHRDLKPDNVMVGRFGEVYVMDWGIAKLVGQGEQPAAEAPPAGTEQTHYGAIVGTPAYMSPEQAGGEIDRLGPASDQFALGLMLHELVTLQPPRRGEDAVAVLQKAVLGRIDAPADGVRIEPELSAIIARATALDPARRYPSVERLEADVRRFLRGEETDALPDSGARRVRRWIVRNQRSTALMVLAIVLGSVLSVGWSGYRRQADLAAQTLESEVRERRIAELLGQVSGRAQRIDNDLLWYEGMLQAIGDSASYALARGTPTDGPWYSAADYRDPGAAPPGMVDSPQYGKPVSPDYPVYAVAPGVPEPLWRRDLALVDGLRDTIRNLFLVDPRSPIPPPDAESQRRRIAGGTRSLRWAYVALERSGLMYMFPGARGWDDKYDPRTRPWYRDAAGGHGRIWSAPYVDLMGQGRLISCLLPLHDAQGTFLGMAGIDLQFNALLDELIKMQELDGYRGAYLLTDDGEVVLKTSAEHDPIVIPPTEVLDPGVDFGRFANDTVVAGARQRRPGHVFVDDEILVWAPLQHLDWTYVVSIAAPR